MALILDHPLAESFRLHADMAEFLRREFTSKTASPITRTATISFRIT